MSFPQGMSYTLLNHERHILSASVPCQGAGQAVMPMEGLGVRPCRSLSAREARRTAYGAGACFLHYLPSVGSSRHKLSNRLQTLGQAGGPGLKQ